MTPAADDALRQKGGYSSLGPRPQSFHPVPAEVAKDEKNRQRAQDQITQLRLIAGIPPILDQSLEAHLGKAGVVRYVLPGLGGEDAGDGLEQVAGEVLPADILDRVEKLIDARLLGVERAAGRLEKAEVIIEFGAELGDLLWLGRLVVRRQGRQLLNLFFNDVLGRLELVRKIIPVRAQLQKLVAITVQLRVTVIGLAKDLLKMVQLFLPALDMSLDVDAGALVCALGDLARR